MDAGTLKEWIAEGWVLPSQGSDGPVFDTADRARIRLIGELIRDFGVNEDSMPLVLQLIDQVHALRHRLAEVQDVIDAMTVAEREDMEARLDAMNRDADL